ncbi:MAG: hypothetical protein HYW07_15460 [Candidatus Latescibacteria bacterium]|nr:hypothetical protein [Candidatus Latescibacterota bacterium]
MPSPADRFTQLQKVAIFLIALGEERARLLLASMELPTIERINQTIAALGLVTPEEKAAVMLEFADFFFEGKSLPAPLADPAARRPTPPPKAKPAPPQAKPAAMPAKPKAAPAKPAPTAKQPPPAPPKTKTPPALLPAAANDDQTTRDALQKLREQVDPKQINWGRAGYDFGEGFKGPKGDRR